MKKIAFLLLVLVGCLRVDGQVIITVAGNGTSGYSGDGNPATLAKLQTPYGVSIDDAGNLYICDDGNACVRKVSPAYGGIITTIAGTGSAGYSGDGGLGKYAQIGGARDIAIDHYGNVYITDFNNHRIRKITPTDTITTIAGTGVAGYNGDGIAASSAQLNRPNGISIDDTGNIYFIDAYNFRIRKIDVYGNIQTVAGTGVAGFSPDGSLKDTCKLNYLYSIARDKDNNIFFSCNGRIRKINASTGIITTVAGNGTSGYSGDGGMATDAKIGPQAIALDTIGNLYMAEGGNNRIRKVDVGGIISTIVGNGIGGYSGDGGNPLFAQLEGAQGVAVTQSGDIFIGDVGNNRIRLVTTHPIAVSSVTISNNLISIYPNPANTHLTITSKEKINSINITNAIGQSFDGLADTTFGGYSMSLDVAHLPSGVYFVWVNGVYVQKFVKE